LFFFLDLGLSQLTSLQFVHCHVAGFYKPTIPQSPPSHLQDYSICNNARLEFSTNFFVPSFDPIEWCLKNGLHSGGSNSQPFSHESSALTTRPRLLAFKINKVCYVQCFFIVRNDLMSQRFTADHRLKDLIETPKTNNVWLSNQNLDRTARHSSSD
jgi:hypothetical protein